MPVPFDPIHSEVAGEDSFIHVNRRVRDGSGSGLGDVDLAGAAAGGGGGDDVLRGGRLTGGLLVQVFGLVLGCALRVRLLRLQLALTLRDDVVRLEAQEGFTGMNSSGLRNSSTN